MASGFRPGEHATGVGPAVQLAWRLTHPTRGVRQQAFELEIDGPAGLRWRSGRVPSALQRADTAELAAELRLPAGAVFRWRARAHLSTVGRSGEQVVAVLECESTFETAPPASAFPGSAKWIGGGGQLHATKGLVLPANASVASARAFVSGVGAFYLYVNGAQVGDHVMDPPQSVYSRRVLFQTFDVAQLLRPGRNEVDALLGNYKWGYTDIWSAGAPFHCGTPHEARFPRRPPLAFSCAVAKSWSIQGSRRELTMLGGR